jgi:hypothetical protein
MAEQAVINTDGRLFTFGCSMTQYNWPTWADILGIKWKYFENWGEPGAGNYFIFNSVIECDIKNNLTPNDTVIIMWTAPARHDCFSGNKWGHSHHIFNVDNNIAPCPDGYWLMSFSYIYAVDQILKNRKIPCKMTSWLNYNHFNSKFHHMYKNLLSNIQYVPVSTQVNKVPNFNDIDQMMKILYNNLSGPDWPTLEDIKQNQYSTTSAIQQEIEGFWTHLNNDKRVSIASTVIDKHPLPGSHLKIAKTIFPELDIDEDTKKWVQLLDNKLKNGEYIKFDKHLPEKNYEPRRTSSI